MYPNPSPSVPINRPKPFRIAEQYLIAAEAAFQLNNEPKATGYINSLRKARGLAELPATTTGPALWNEVKLERTHELAYKGFRLADLRRWGDPVVRKPAQTGAEPLVDKQCDPVGYIHPTTDPHFVWPLPPSVILEGGLQQNPGY